MFRTIASFFAALTLVWPLGAGHAVAGPEPAPFATAVNTPRGELRNPYIDVAKVAKEGHKIYLSHDCNGCHGGGGGGGDGGASHQRSLDLWRRWGHSVPGHRARHGRAQCRGTPSKNRASCARVRRTSSALCRPSAKFSEPTTTSGRSSPGSGSSIASVIQPRVERAVSLFRRDMP